MYDIHHICDGIGHSYGEIHIDGGYPLGSDWELELYVSRVQITYQFHDSSSEHFHDLIYYESYAKFSNGDSIH